MTGAQFEILVDGKTFPRHEERRDGCCHVP
jgi:hypothetical protein